MAAFAALCVGCQDEISTTTPVVGGEGTFTATFESNETRAYLDANDYCRWEMNDKVAVFNETGNLYTYYATQGDGTVTKLGTNDTPEFSGENIYAIFPYSADNKLVNGEFTSVIPAEQVYNKEKVSLNNAIMVAKTPVGEWGFMFKNSCALIKLNCIAPAGFENVFKVNSIKVESKANNLAGTVTIGDDFTAKISNATGKIVTMTECAEAGYMTAENKTFVLVIPAGTYAAGDLTFTFDADDDRFDYTTTLNNEFTVGRSEYITLNASLPGPVLMLRKTEFENKAIMCHVDLAKAQGFGEQHKFAYEYDIPEGNMVIDGGDKTYNFRTTANDVYVLNTFLANCSGKNGVEPGRIFVKNMTIKGELRSTCLGTYVGAAEAYKPYNNGYNFYTELTNVNILDNQIIPMTESGVAGASVSASSAVCVYGTAVLNNCNIYGSVPAQRALEHPTWCNIPVVDMTGVNSSTTTINGGHIGHIEGTEHADFIIQNGATVDYLHTIGVSVNNLAKNVINDATVTKLVLDPSGSYDPHLQLNAGAKVGTLEFIGYTVDSKPENFFNAVSIAADAQVDKVIVDGTEMTLADFKANYLNN